MFCILRGGVIVADIITKKLQVTISNFDILLPRKLITPDNEENAFGAVIEDDSIMYLDNRIVDVLSILEEYIKKEKERQIVKRRALLYRRGSDLLLLDYYSKITINPEIIVILVDYGAATGATIIAAARWPKGRKYIK